MVDHRLLLARGARDRRQRLEMLPESLRLDPCEHRCLCGQRTAPPRIRVTGSVFITTRSQALSHRDDSPRVKWARLGSNQRPPACEAGALPLSYAPSRVAG